MVPNSSHVNLVHMLCRGLLPPNLLSSDSLLKTSLVMKLACAPRVAQPAKFGRIIGRTAYPNKIVRTSNPCSGNEELAGVYANGLLLDSNEGVWGTASSSAG